MKWYLSAVKSCINFTGRARRAEYWYFTFINIAIQIGLLLLFATGSIIESAPIAIIFGIAFLVYYLAMIIPGLAVTVRRLHDTGKSGAYLFLSLVPVVGPFIVLIQLVCEGTPGQNRYGPSPKHETMGGGGFPNNQFGNPQQFGAPGQQPGYPYHQ